MAEWQAGLQDVLNKLTVMIAFDRKDASISTLQQLVLLSPYSKNSVASSSSQITVLHAYGSPQGAKQIGTCDAATNVMPG